MDTIEHKTIVKPFVKWMGSKKQHLPVFRTLYPSGLGSSITKYAEPFVGGGTVLFDILSTYNLEEIYISDTNESLINTYLVIKNKCDELIECLTGLDNEYSGKSFDERKSMYYCKRNEFNNVKRFSNSDKIEIAALFIFLNKTCFNGVYRVNSKNEFNVPSGRYKNPKILDAENLLNISQKLKRVTICCDDFRNVLPFVDEHTFVYFDPPYRPIRLREQYLHPKRL